MSGMKIWWLRVKQNWIYQTKIFRLVFDWTVIVYLLIPAIVFTGIAYKSWLGTMPGLLDPIPYELFFLVCFFFCWQGGIRTFMEEADQLTLLQFPKVMYTIRFIGVVYSWSLILLKWLFIVIWLYPLLNHFPQLEAGRFLAMIFFFLSMNILLTTYKQEVNRYGWLKRLYVHTSVFSLTSILVFVVLLRSINVLCIIISIFFILFAIGQVKVYQSQIATFFEDVEKEQRIKVKYIMFLFAVNPEIAMPRVKKQKKRSWLLWKDSTRIFQDRSPANGVTELFIKAFFRDKSNIVSYLQLISITAVIIFATPIWIKWIVFIAFFFFFTEWISLVFRELVKQNQYLSTDYGEKTYMFAAKKKCQNLFVYPAVVMVLVVTCMSTVISLII